MHNELDLINAINSFDGQSESFEVLRDIICELSDGSNYESSDMTGALLFMAAEKLGIFGYNVLNHLTMPFRTETYSLEYRARHELYSTSYGDPLDKPQKMVMDTFETANRRLMLSAPTSFGKTFILRDILYANRERYRKVICIFPTISLINENTRNLKSFSAQHELGYRIVNNTRYSIDWETERIIFVLTPERALKLLTDKEAKFDFFFFDEIQKVDEKFDANDAQDPAAYKRDIAFRVVLYVLAKAVPECYIAGPYISLENLGQGFRRFLNENKIKPVEHKLEFVKKKHVKAWTSSFELESTETRFRGRNKSEKTRQLVEVIHDRELGNTIIYAESKKKAGTVAREIASFLGRQQLGDRLQNFIRHLQQRYSLKYEGMDVQTHWTLINALRCGVGIHHGGLPKYIQREVLNLFNDGDLAFLVATTSIAEGVNTNAKNVVFYGKSKGGEKLNAFDIKNINGRAGRYYHHFVGRIFYLEREIYETLSAPDPSLDYATFGDEEIGYLDLDNAELADLSDANRRRKQEREELINSYGIPASVFQQNRLVDRLKQLNLIVTIHRLGAEGARRFVRDCSSIRDFLRSGVIYRILELLSQADIVNDHDVARFGKIVLEYVRPDGWQRLMLYQLGQSGSLGDDAIDSAYTRVFADISNIVEYRIPMLLSVFSNLLSYVCGTLNISSESLALDAVVQFFEFGGVSTELGVTLADGGFPLRTVRLLEQQQPGLMALPVEEFLQRLMALDSRLTILLDNYEITLLSEILG